MGVDPHERRERPCQGAQVQTRTYDDGESTTCSDLTDRQRREVARLTALSEDDWREELAATLWECKRLRLIDVDEILAAPSHPPMPAAPLAVDRARLEAAEFLIDRGSLADARLAAGWLIARAA